MKITGRTIQVGGPLIACNKGSEADRLWFASHFGRHHRIRKPLGRERELAPCGRGLKPMIAVRQIEPGARIRVPFGWRGPRLLNAESVAAEVFAAAAAGRSEVAEIERLVREGKL